MSALAELLAREGNLVREFITSLTDEQAALKRGEVQVLAAIGSRKAELAEQLNAIEHERNAMLESGGLAGNREGMRDWLARNPGNRLVAQAWAALLVLASQARELNNLNGQLIAMRLHATNQALATLQQEARTSTLYGPDGQAAQHTGSRIIDAA